MDHTQFKKLTSQELDKSRKVPLSFSLRTSLIDLMLRLKYHNVMCWRDSVPFVQFKNMKSTHGGVLLLVKKPATLLKVTLLHGCFSQLHKWYQIA